MAVLIMLASTAGRAAVSAAPATVEPSSTAVTTDRLNLRSGPSATDGVIAVMPAGETVTLSGQSINDYLFVTWKGQNGWAHREWLRVVSTPSEKPSTAVTTDALNMRSGAALSYPVITVLPKGATVTLTGKEDNGYRAISYNGRDGWAFGAYLAESAPAPAPSTTATVTERLNPRTGPSQADAVVTVLPAGAVVTVTGDARNGYRPVTWSGYSGWAHGDWLTFGTTPPPAEPEPEPEPEPAPQTTGVTTDTLNMRSGPATSYSVVTVIPPGTKIVLTGKRDNGYLAVSWNGRNGWAHGDWITPEGAEPTPTGTATATDRLNLRSGPATSYDVLGVIPAGAAVTLNGQESNGYTSVTWNGITGWAFGAYLSPGATTPPPDPEPQPGPGTSDAPFDVTNTIVGPTRGSADEAVAFARQAGAQRMDEVERYIREVYRLGPQIGFDPAIIVAQSALETGYWKSSWWIDRLNPAGIGVTGDPAQNAASPNFPSGTIAARAQMAHMHAEVFGSSRPLPAELQGVDPTYQRVFAAGWAGTIRTINDLAGTWAVDPQYGHKIVRVGREIFE
jgi:uncharacterized protein YraI